MGRFYAWLTTQARTVAYGQNIIVTNVPGP